LPSKRLTAPADTYMCARAFCAAASQCGGTAGAPSAAAALDAPWPAHACAAGLACMRRSAASWLCQARAGAAASATPPPPPPPPPPALVGQAACPPLGAGLVPVSGGDRAVTVGARLAMLVCTRRARCILVR